jgi:hypothetical protein
MMLLVYILLGVVGAALALFLLLWLNTVRATLKLDRQLDKEIAPAIRAARRGGPDAAAVLAEFAERLDTRNHLYAKLEKMGRADLFPAEYRSLDKIAASDLARWLLHPNELGAAPAETELVRELPVVEGPKIGSLFLFRFRTDPSHWAADRGWMAGVAGPYWDGEAAVSAGGTFSELSPFDEMSEEQHVEFLREQVGRKGLVMPS